MNFLEFDSIIITVFFILIQVCFFITTIIKLCKIYKYLPENKAYYIDDDTQIIKIRKSFKINVDFKNLMNEINDYIIKNEGTADFAIIQNKVERIIKAKYDDAISKISFPTYLGLMGTFLGVSYGLLQFNSGDSVVTGLVTDERITELISGVLISMITSFCGLFFMIISNFIATCVKKQLDIDKNNFYEFIQNQLLPELGTSMVSALSKLRKTINKFEPAFNNVITNFQNTFEECTRGFGDTFRDNVVVVSNAVTAMGDNIQVINDNVRYQRELLQAIGSNGFNEGIENFIRASEVFERQTELISQIELLNNRITNSTNELIATQSNYNKSLEVPQSIVVKLNEILDRISTFEENLNVFGENISQTQLLGNTQMNLIEQQINAIQSKTDIALRYQDVANDNLNDMFVNQSNEIRRLSDRYQSLISQHGDELENMLETMSNELTRKWQAFISTLENAFEVSTIETEFTHLNKLPIIEEKLSDVERAITEKKSIPDVEDRLSNIENKIPSIKNIEEKLNDIVMKISQLKIQQGSNSNSSLNDINSNNNNNNQNDTNNKKSTWWPFNR